MILRRPLLNCVCPLLTLLVSLLTARADTDVPAQNAAVASQSPAEHAAPVVSAPEPESAPAVAEVPVHPAAEAPAPARLEAVEPALVTAPAEKSIEPEAAAAEIAARIEAPKPAATAAKPARPVARTPAEWGDTGHDEIVGLLSLGVSLTERGDFDAAEIAFRQIMASRRATGDDLAHALLGLARCFRRQGTLTRL